MTPVGSGHVCAVCLSTGSILFISCSDKIIEHKFSGKIPFRRIFILTVEDQTDLFC